MSERVFTLTPKDRKSFYGKMHVIERNGEKLLQSYNTIVCKIDACGNFKRLWNGWSATTQRHVNAFVDYYGMPELGGKSNKRAHRVKIRYNKNGDPCIVIYGYRIPLSECIACRV